VLAPPGLEDAAGIWRLARDSGELDLNSPYCYLLWCRDFAATSVVARLPASGPGPAPVGFVTGYLRPGRPGTLVVWQVAVDRPHRGRGLAAAMLDDLLRRAPGPGVSWVEATVTPGNLASERLFGALGRRHGAPVERTPLFGPGLFPTAHEPEVLFRVGPLAPSRRREPSR
jgi:L-2,4-diaminobutyric acid acetyltransferase